MEEMTERIAYLRARGVEVDLPEERRAKSASNHDKPPSPTNADAPSFTYLHLPHDANRHVRIAKAQPRPYTDVLPSHLAPAFATDQSLDDDTVARESAARLASMVQAGGDVDLLKTPTAAAIAREAAGGACEAYPLSQSTPENGFRAVRLYIDEVGALRGRPRNRRAEELAAAAGLHGLSIHGDAYVGRCESQPGKGETNVSFRLDELAHDSEWIASARRVHAEAATRGGHGDDEHLASGDAGLYSWSQTEDEVEVHVRGAPEGKGAARRIRVSYASGQSLTVFVDGAEVLSVAPLFDRVLPDDCSWLLDGGCVVITLGKAEPRPWATLALPKAT